MRKYLIILSLILVLILGACGSDPEPSETEAEIETEPEIEHNEEVQEFIEKNNVKLDEDGYFEETNDPLEAGNKNNGIVVFNNDEYGDTYIIKQWYTNDDTDDDGFNHIDFDGYKVKFAVALMEDVDEEDTIGFFVETENNTDKTIQYNMDMEIITDEQEQTNTDDMYAIGDSKPGIKTKGFVKANLDYDTPEEITITFEPPWDDEDEFNAEVGTPIELEFSLE